MESRSSESAVVLPASVTPGVVLSPEATSFWHRHGRIEALGRGSTALAEGTRPYSFCIIVNGGVRISTQMRGRERRLLEHTSGSFVGELGLLTGGPCPATVTASCQTTLLYVENEVFRREVALGCPEADVIIRTLALRTAELASFQEQERKLEALGRMSATLAHHLGNPVSAILSLTDSLAHIVDRSHSRALDRFSPPDRVSWNVGGASPHSSALRQSEMEERIATWLESQGYPNLRSYAATLAANELTTEDLAVWLSALGDEFSVAVARLADSLSLQILMTSLRASSRQIQRLSSLMSLYTRQGRPALEEVDLHANLDVVLDLLRVRSRERKVKVVRNYHNHMPSIFGSAAELNEVWFSLIENAIEALPVAGSIWITTLHDHDSVLVQIEDDGPGISPAVQSRMFEPFVSTKEKDANLLHMNLNYAYRSVVHHHGGELRFRSEPGHTSFEIRLPASNTAPPAITQCA